jgi:O-antigen/teichoic acid export membrane protein
MSPAEYGRIALFMSFLFVVAPMISFAADNLIAINKSRLEKVKYEHFRRSFVTFAYLIFVVIQIVFISLFPLGILHDRLFLLIPIYGLVQFLTGMASIEYVMEEKPIQFGLVALSTTLVSLLLTILFLNAISGVADYRIAALLIANVIFLFVRYHRRMKFLWTFSVDKRDFKDIVLFGFPLMLSIAPAWALNESDKMIVAKYVDLASVGYYAAACAIGGIMITFNTAMLNTMIPKIYQALGENKGQLMAVVKKYAMKFLGTSAVFGVFFALVYALLADLILPVKYSSARPIVFVIIIFSLGRSLYSILGLVSDYYKMTIEKLKGIIYGGVAAIISTFFGIKYFGIMGAAFGVGSGYLVLSLTLWVFLRKKSQQETASFNFIA